MTQGTPSTPQPSQTGQVVMNKKTSTTSLKDRPRRTSPSPSLSSSSPSSASAYSSNSQPRLSSISGWVFDQDYWRGPQIRRPISTKGPTVVVIRHAEGLHNVTQPTSKLQRKVNRTRDPSLTPEGFRQAAGIQATHPSLVRKVRELGARAKVFSSPLARTLETAYTAFPFLQAGEVIISPDLQEGPNLAYNIGSAPVRLVKKLNETLQSGGRRFDASHFTALSPDWFKKEGPYAPNADLILARSRKVRRYIRSLDLDLVVVVTHAGVMPGFCEDRVRQAIDNCSWYNAEVRAYCFDPADTTAGARLTSLSPAMRAVLFGTPTRPVSRAASRDGGD